MTPRERFMATLDFKPPDIPVLEYYYTEVGFADHGEELLKLYEKYPGDTRPVPAREILKTAKPDPKHIQEDGSYYKLEKDQWGTTWEYKIYGRIGQPKEYPLADLSNLDEYEFPPIPLTDPAAREALRKHVRSDGRTYPIFYSIAGLFYVLSALRPMEDVLADIAAQDPRIEKLADMLTDRFTKEAGYAIKAGVDGISIGDDFGTQNALIMSRKMWRRFFFPRLKRIFDVSKDAGMKCNFHSCGQVWELMDDFKEMGADSIWPQLPLYNYSELAKKLKALKMALCMHIDRGDLMLKGTPEQIKIEVERIFKAFRPDLGGSWFYFEVDQDFPFENIKTLADAINEYR